MPSLIVSKRMLPGSRGVATAFSRVSGEIMYPRGKPVEVCIAHGSAPWGERIRRNLTSVAGLGIFVRPNLSTGWGPWLHSFTPNVDNITLRALHSFVNLF